MPSSFRSLCRAAAPGLALAIAAAACSDSVGSKDDKVTEIAVELGDVTLAAGKTVQIGIAGGDQAANLAAPVLVSLFDAQHQYVFDQAPTFASSDTTVAKVDAAGLVRAVAPGSATITVKTRNASGTVAVAVERPYTLTYLGSPGDAMSRANAINANGDVAGVFAAGAGTHAFRWHAGQRTDLGVGGANAINSAGDVAGQGWTGSDFRALVWHGTVGDTVPLSGTNAYFAANGVSAGGTVLVERHAAACGHDCSFQTYVVQGGTPTPIVASQLEGLALNDAGLVVGQRWDPVTSTTNAFTAQNGTVTMLSPGVVAAAYAVNAAGLVVGYAAVPGGARAATWQNGASTEMPALRRGSLAGAQGVNGSGVVVGSATLCPGSCATRAAVRWKAGHVADLNDLFTSADWTMTYATGINDAGQIVGYGVNRATGASGALLLTPAA